jgi:hypothetical protein
MVLFVHTFAGGNGSTGIAGGIQLIKNGFPAPDASA